MRAIVDLSSFPGSHEIVTGSAAGSVTFARTGGGSRRSDRARGLVAPPAAPFVVAPWAALRAELVAAHDLGTDVAGDRVK
jgi:hypothetical protein